MTETLFDTTEQLVVAEPEDTSRDSYKEKLLKIVRKVQRFERDYAVAMRIFERADRLKRDVVEFVAANCPEGYCLNDNMTMIDALEILSNREKDLKIEVPLEELGINGKLVVKKELGGWKYNSLYSVRLNLKKK